MNRFAYWVSAIFNPLFVGIPVMLAIGIAETGIRWEATPTVLAAIFVMTVVPTVYVIVLMRRGVFENFHVSDRRQRKYLFPVLILCFAVTIYLLWRDPAIGRLVVATLAFGLPNVILIALISLRLKVSLHCAGIGGMLPAVAYPFGMPGLTAGTAALLLTAWSRVRMNEHSTIEVITGSLLGAGLMALELAWLFGWPRII
ncbi:MAG: hypothetical protein ACOY5B_14420 [Spirochaetota bacterium]